MEINEKNSHVFLTSGKRTYRICGFLWVIILSIVLVIGSLFLLGKGINDIINNDFDINHFIVSIILLLISGILTYFYPLYSSITIDMNNKLVTIKKYRFLFLKNKITKIDTEKIVRAYAEKNKEESFGRSKEKYYGFDLIFLLNTGERLVPLEGEIDKNNESRKLNYFLSDFFLGSVDDNNKDNVLIQLESLDTK